MPTPTFSGYLAGISRSGYAASFDLAGLGLKLGVLPVSGISSSTLSGFLVDLANTTFVASGWESALSAQSLVPGENIPAEASTEAGLLVVSVLLDRAAGPATPLPFRALPQLILARLNGIAVAKGFGG